LAVKVTVPVGTGPSLGTGRMSAVRLIGSPTVALLEGGSIVSSVVVPVLAISIERAWVEVCFGLEESAT
jgi:hypothetical protein